MSYFEFPHTRTYDTDLGWLIRRVRELGLQLEEFVNFNTIKYADPIEWNITRQYEGNTVVIDPSDGTAYISTRPVPSGVAITNTRYWTPIFNYGANMDMLREVITARNEHGSPTATAAYSEGDLFWRNSELYIITADIAAGTAFIEGVNCEHITVEDWVHLILDETIGGIIFDSVTDMLAADLKDGDRAITLGYHSVGDGGGGEYKIKAAAGSGDFGVSLNNGNFAKLIIDTSFNTRQVGLWGDNNHDDSEALQAVLNYMESTASIKKITVSAGLYKVTRPITIPHGVALEGPQRPRTPMWKDGAWVMADVSGAVFCITGSEGSDSPVNAAFKMMAYSALRRIGFWYPRQPVMNLQSSTPPIVYPPVITLIEDPLEYNSRNNGALIDEIMFTNAYYGINATVEHGCMRVINSEIFAYKNVVKIKNSIDVDRLQHLQINPMLLYSESWPEENVKLWQMQTDRDNSAIWIISGDATLCEDVFIYSFWHGIRLVGETDSVRPNGVQFIACNSEGGYNAVYASAHFNRLKFVNCSFGTDSTMGGYAMNLVGNSAGTAGEVYLTDVSIWRAKGRALFAQLVLNMSISNLTVRGSAPNGASAPSGAVVLSTCYRVKGVNLDLGCAYDAEDTNNYYMYISGCKGVTLNNIYAYGLASETGSRFAILQTARACILRNILCSHQTTVYIAQTATECSADAVIQYQ